MRRSGAHNNRGDPTQAQNRKNFDTVLDVDLGSPAVQREAINYLDSGAVFALAMAPNCRGVGNRSWLNAVLNHDAWRQRYLEDQPRVQFCDRAALHQLRRGRTPTLGVPICAGCTPFLSSLAELSPLLLVPRFAAADTHLAQQSCRRRSRMSSRR